MKKNKTWVKKFLENADQYGAPCQIMYQARSTHPSKFGGVFSILSSVLVCYYFAWRIVLWTTTERDDYVSVGIQSHLPDRDPLYLKGSDVDFRISIEDPEFDNTNNEYGELKAHLYSTMNDNTTQEDIIIPLISDCEKKEEEEEEHAHNYTFSSSYNVWNKEGTKVYCPVFNDEHYLKNDHESTKY